MPDMTAEHDARRLYAVLRQSGITFSPQCVGSLEQWLDDERRHFLGFREIAAQLLGWDEATVEEAIATEASDFSAIVEFMGDEFLLALTVAYDELATVLSYGDDRPLYRALGADCLTWFNRVIADEAAHLKNFAAVIRQQHAGRMGEIPGLVDALVRHDLLRPPYRRTFVLDRTSPTFTPAYLWECGERLKRLF